MNNWEESFSSIRADRLHGASWLYKQALELLASRSLGEPIRSREELGEIASVLHQVQPSMAPFHFLANKISSLEASHGKDVNSAFANLVTELIRNNELAHERIATNFEKLNLNPKRVMLHSNSGTVHGLVQRTISIESTIFISEGRPELEGLQLAGDLVIDGYTVKTFVDDARAELLKAMDLVIIGSDWISEADFINKIGTLSLTLLARELGKALFVVADSTKLAHSRFRTDNAKPGSNRKETFYQDILFESTPLDNATAFVTDIGILTPTQMKSHFASKQ